MALGVHFGCECPGGGPHGGFDLLPQGFTGAVFRREPVDDRLHALALGALQAAQHGREQFGLFLRVVRQHGLAEQVQGLGGGLARAVRGIDQLRQARRRLQLRHDAQVAARERRDRQLGFLGDRSVN
jgi:hypothetical protein